ncbi:MAG: rRNA maturation RNase YbeY [Candidatus Omnitrophota bacterium]
MTITIKNLQNKIHIRPKRIKQIILKVLAAETVKKPAQINVCFVGDSCIKELNRAYLKKDSPTDVLAFDMSAPPDAGSISADIVVSTETAVRNAGIFKTSKIFEAYLYLVHGVLHILGYRDDNPKGKKLMQDKAEEILSSLNLNPTKLTCLSRKTKP